METKFKRVLLSYNEEGFNNEVENLQKQCDAFNLQIGNARRILRHEDEFTSEQKLSIKENAFQFLNDFLNEIKPFKNADLDFNLEAIGMNEAKGILQEWKTRTNEFRAYEFELNGLNRFEVTEKQIQNAKERNTVYTDSIEQNIRLEVASELAKTLNRFFDLGMISIYNRPTIAKCIQGITIDVNPETSQYHFVIDSKNI
jgi:hypothetical protein